MYVQSNSLQACLKSENLCFSCGQMIPAGTSIGHLQHSHQISIAIIANNEPGLNTNKPRWATSCSKWPISH